MLFVGDDWAEDHHDVEVLDEDGRRLARARLPEGIAGLTRLHELIAEHLADDDVDPGDRVRRAGRGGRDRDRPRPLGGGAARGRLSGVRDQPDVGGPLPGAARHLGGEVRPRAMRTCWPRSSVWTAPITGRSPGTAPRWRG